MKQRKINFSAGPSKLPLPVLQSINESLLTYKDSGVGICELGHRTKYFQEIVDETKALIRELIELPAHYEILFMTGGASQQFSAVPLNILGRSQASEQAGYLISGHWAKAAYTEARKFSNVVEVGTSEESGFCKIPAVNSELKNLKYVHYTSNNTIFGTQFPSEPETGNIPLVCDASSDILSRKIDISKYSLIYAGAQKNLGTPGVTIVILDPSINLEKSDSIPKMIDYQTYIASGSLYNTPPVLPIYATLESLRWIKSIGGLSAIEKRNEVKAKKLYDFIDQSQLFHPFVSAVEGSSRSKMNVVFSIEDKNFEEDLLTRLKNEGILGLAGHRSVGGFRASLYNAIEESEVDKLIAVLQDFEGSK